MGEETIAAIATAAGESSIGIVRVSGPASVKIARAVFRNFRNQSAEDLFPRKMTYGKLVDPDTGEMIDEVLVVFMPAPHSYTCEDVVEFQVHGGSSVLRRLLRLLLQNGARMAQPGEFTQRAFLNGRIDLSQAEAVMDIIRAKSEFALINASNQLSGNLSKRIAEVRRGLLDLLTVIEAVMDYPDEDLDRMDLNRVEKTLCDSARSLDALLSTASYGMILREGLSTVIVGRPNVGKSSLLNALLGENRALVTEIPGTTRDSIEEYLNLRGIPLKIIDTAGLRESQDLVEQLGIERTRAALSSAALVLFLLDASQPLSKADIDLFQSLPSVPVIIVVNKIDLPQLMDSSEWTAFSKAFQIVSVSAKERQGFETLERAIEQLVLCGAARPSEPVFLNNSRQVDCVSRARKNILSAVEALQAGLSVDCVTVDVRAALECLGQLNGESVSEEIIREIFAKFCLGK